MRYIVAYDISSDARRSKLLHLLKNYGIPVQYSIVECDLTRPLLAKLMSEVSSLIKPRTDRVAFYGQCDACVPRTEWLGKCRSSPALRM